MPAEPSQKHPLQSRQASEHQNSNYQYKRKCDRYYFSNAAEHESMSKQSSPREVQNTEIQIEVRAKDSSKYPSVAHSSLTGPQHQQQDYRGSLDQSHPSISGKTPSDHHQMQGGMMDGRNSNAPSFIVGAGPNPDMAQEAVQINTQRQQQAALEEQQRQTEIARLQKQSARQPKGHTNMRKLITAAATRDD